MTIYGREIVMTCQEVQDFAIAEEDRAMLLLCGGDCIGAMMLNEYAHEAGELARRLYDEATR